MASVCEIHRLSWVHHLARFPLNRKNNNMLRLQICIESDKMWACQYTLYCSVGHAHFFLPVLSSMSLLYAVPRRWMCMCVCVVCIGCVRMYGCMMCAGMSVRVSVCIAQFVIETHLQRDSSSRFTKITHTTMQWHAHLTTFEDLGFENSFSVFIILWHRHFR